MPRNVNPASITVGAGIAPQGTVEDNSLRHPQRDTEPLRAHLLDPNNAHMASAIGIVDAGGYYASTDVEGALQEIGAGGAAGRHNGLVIGGTFTSGPGLLTLDTPTVVLIGGVAASFGGATVVLPPSVTRYVWVDPATSTLTASAVLPPVSSEPILIAKVTTDAGANVTASQDARFFVANLDRKVDYTLRSDGSAVNDASEACFVTLDAALFWLENYVATAQERKALVLVRGEHVISSTVVVPTGIPNIEFRGEGAATFATGASLNPVFNVSGTVGLTFTGLTFRCDHAGSVAIRTATGALACSNVTVQNCRFTVGGSTWNDGVVLDAATPATQQGHRVLGSQFTVNNNGVRIASAVDGVVRDCTFTGTSVVGSTGVSLTRVAGTGENCVVENAKVFSGFSTPFNITTFTSTLRDSQASGGGSLVGGEGAVVSGCFLSGVTDTTAGLLLPNSAFKAMVSNTTVTTTTAWAGADDPAGIRVEGDAVVVSGCSVSGFYNPAGSAGAGVRLVSDTNHKVSTTDISNCHTGVELLGVTTGTVEGCTITAKVRGVFSDTTSLGTKVTNTSVVLDSVTGLQGIVLEGAGPTVTGCQLATTRPFNAYLVGDMPAGILCGVNVVNGPYIITGCALNNFYNAIGQVGGGVVYKGGVNGLTVSGCTFKDCGVFGDNAASVTKARVTGCLFDTNTPNLQRVGVALVAVNDVLDTTVSGCTFSFVPTASTTNAVEVACGNLARFIVADCTYTAAGALGGAQRFVKVLATTTGEGVVIEGNSVRYPVASPLGPVEVLGVSTLLVGNNTFLADAASVAVALATDAKQVDYTGNTVVNMNGVDLVSQGGFVPTFRATGNTFDGGSDTAAYGVRVVPSNGALSMGGFVATGNTFRAVLDGLRLTNPLNTLTLTGTLVSGNTFGSCRNGVTTDADNYDNFLVTGNTFGVYNYAVYQTNAASTGKTIKVDGNLVTQAGFVPAFVLGLVGLAGASLNGVSVSGNQFDHEGSISAIAMLVSGDGPEDLTVDGNTVRNEAAAAGHAIVAGFTVTNPAAAQASNISFSRNKVNHFGGVRTAIRLVFTGSTASNVVRNVRLDDNHVVVVQDNAANLGVDLVCAGSGGNFPTLRGVSMCRNTVLAYGASVRLAASDAAGIEDVLICDNTTLAGNAASVGALQFSCTYTGPIPVGAVVNNVSMCRNLVQSNLSNYAVRVTCAAPVVNLSVDDNSVQQVGDAGNPSVGSGNIYLFLNNASGFPAQDAATGVSVCRNKVSGAALPNYGEAAILLTSAAGLVTAGKNIMVDGNEVFNHDGAAIKVQLGYDTLRNLSVSDNKVHTVAHEAVVVERVSAVYGLGVSHNRVHGALTGGAIGDATLKVDTLNGGGFVFTGNSLGNVSRKGIFVDGGSAVGSLEGVTFTGNTVDFTSGAGAAEEGLYVFWQHSLYGATATGNFVQGAEKGIYIDGGLVTSNGFIVSNVEQVTVTGNTLSVSNYGVWVSSHTTNSGAGTALLSAVNISGNTVKSPILGGSLLNGVLVAQVFGTKSNVTVAQNIVDMGSGSTGEGVRVDGGGADFRKVSVVGNTVEYGNVGVYLLATATSFYDVTVTGNRVTDLGERGILLFGMSSIRNMAVDDNHINDVDLGVLVGQGIALLANNLTANVLNLSVSRNHIRSTALEGISISLLRNSGTAGVRNLKVSGNTIAEWNASGTSTLLPAIRVNTCIVVGDPNPLYNLDVSNNSCLNVTDDYVSGFTFSLDEETRQVVFAHNQVLLNNQANAGSMSWNFLNTGGAIPKDFTFTGNQFRDTTAAPVYTGTGGDFAVFQGNIGSVANFWTTFATNWATVLPAVVNNQNFDNGT